MHLVMLDFAFENGCCLTMDVQPARPALSDRTITTLRKTIDQQDCRTGQKQASLINDKTTSIKTPLAVYDLCFDIGKRKKGNNLRLFIRQLAKPTNTTYPYVHFRDGA
jgi:hypothetical protein